MFDRILLTVTIILEPVLGLKWAYRLICLLHAIPYLALAFAWGWLCGWVWGFYPMIGGYVCVGLLFAFMCLSWFNSWRFYRRNPDLYLF